MRSNEATLVIADNSFAVPNSCSPCANAATRAGESGSSAARYMSTPIRRIRSGCCARAASDRSSDDIAAAPPSSVRNSRRLMSNMARFPPPASAGVSSPRLLARYRRDFNPELYPQKHGQEDQDRVQHDPHNVGSPTPSLVYSLLAHGEFSLASHAMVSPLLSLPPNGWTGPWDKPELF